MKGFEEYLKDLHADNYMGTDDDMSDDFEQRLEDYDAEEYIATADRYVKDVINTLREDIKSIKGVYSANDALTKVDELLSNVWKS